MKAPFIKPALFVLLGIFIGMYFLRCGNDAGIGSDFDGTKYYTKDEINHMMEDYLTQSDVDQMMDDYLTQSDVDLLMNDYYTQSEVNSMMADYLTQSDVDQMMSDYYTQADVDLMMADYYTQFETDILLNQYYSTTDIDSILTQYYQQSEVDNLISKNKSSIIYGKAAVGSSGTTYIIFELGGGLETMSRLVVPTNGVMRNLYVVGLGDGSPTYSVDVTVRLNQADATLVLNYAAADSGTTKANTSDSVTVNQGDEISIELQETNGTGSSDNLLISLLLDAEE